MSVVSRRGCRRIGCLLRASEQMAAEWHVVCWRGIRNCGCARRRAAAHAAEIGAGTHFQIPNRLEMRSWSFADLKLNLELLSNITIDFIWSVSRSATLWAIRRGVASFAMSCDSDAQTRYRGRFD